MSIARTALVVVLSALAAVGGQVGPATAAPAVESSVGAPTTALTLTIGRCEGCTVAPASALRADDEDFWQGPSRRVRDGQVTLRVPTDRTAGLSLALSAPWEGRTGYQTMVALRYRGHAPGEQVARAQARDADRASGCWAGTTEPEAEMTVKVRRQRVPGVDGMAAGTIAWAKVTQGYLFPLVRVHDGVLGTQELLGCGPKA